jgi:hypothetical protein
VVSITRAVNAGTGSTPCARTASDTNAASNQTMTRFKAWPCYFLVPKSTVGGTVICASFCTAKTGLGE